MGKQSRTVVERALTDPKYKTRPRYRTLIRQFGWYAIVSLVGGTMVIFACVGFIAFLWAGNERNQLWNRIVVEGWLTRCITIASVLLRSVITIQAGVATAMLAALFLHTFSVTLPVAAPVSIARYADTAPHSLLWTVFNGRMFGRPGRKATLGLLTLLLCMTVTTVLLQFISTALLSNVGRATVAEKKRMSSVAYAFRPGTRPTDREINFVMLAPPAYPAFAEYTEPTSTSGGIMDTGLSIRAFLPVKSANERNVMTSYSGVATLMDTRVVCVRPNITDLRLYQGNTTKFEFGGNYRLQGKVTAAVKPERFNGTNPVEFDCLYARPDEYFDETRPKLRGAGRDADQWYLTMCGLETSGGVGRGVGQIKSIMTPSVISPELIGKIGYAQTYLLINATNYIPGWPPGTHWPPYREEAPVHDNRSVWADFPTPNFNADVSSAMSKNLQITVCYVNPVVRNVKIEARRGSGISSEPEVTWSNATVSFENDAVRQQLGATVPISTPQERGIFNLSRLPSWEPPVKDGVPLIESAIGYVDGSTDFGGLGGAIQEAAIAPAAEAPVSTIFCFFCEPSWSPDRYTSVSRVLITTFQDTIRETGNPALAIQSFLTTVVSSKYYYQLPQFFSTAPATIVSNAEVTRPTGWLYFILVNICLALHFVFILIIALLYILSDGETLIGNAWSVVGQLQSPECKPWLDTAGNMTDGEVGKAMKSAKRGKVNVGINGGLEDYPRIKQWFQ